MVANVFACLGAIGLLAVAVMMYLTVSRWLQLRRQRLQMLQEALRHPALDEATRRAIVTSLGRQHARLGWLWRYLPHAYFALAWVVFCGSGIAWLLASLNGRYRDVEATMAGFVAGFLMLSTPVAVRELLGRHRTA